MYIYTFIYPTCPIHSEELKLVEGGVPKKERLFNIFYFIFFFYHTTANILWWAFRMLAKLILTYIFRVYMQIKHELFCIFNNIKYIKFSIKNIIYLFLSIDSVIYIYSFTELFSKIISFLNASFYFIYLYSFNSGVSIYSLILEFICSMYVCMN